jgi:hypothetical protein
MMDKLQNALGFLRLFRLRAERRDENREAEYSDLLHGERVAAAAAGDEARAKYAWILAKTLSTQQQYQAAFTHMQEGRFYEAWRLLERVEIALIWLQRHITFTPEFGLDVIDEQTPRFQKLYPYGIFTSPAYIEKERRCSICDALITIRSRCGHQIGEIYGGEMCTNVISMAELLEISLVTNPVHKANVVFLRDPKTGERVDQFDYSILSYVIAGLCNPYDAWIPIRTMRRHPHARYKHVGRNGMCPCESGRKYKACCLGEDGVLRPHIDIDFAIPPPKTLPPLTYSRNA